ncbi:hypothetical protein [Lederbergia lenta]|uniref:hypothetical protein n=1 Tax=Lederbergia lenta TaxID=1467 RepID=UPI002040A6D3|nr:hypothetical protein [Lederbergia lenta]MCM3110426.1 hypothetical protein [Lederbergia lenta]
MRKTNLVNNLDIYRSHMSFILPLGYDISKKNELVEILNKNSYSFFQIDDSSRNMDIYGEKITVEGKELEQYFLPYIEGKLFPSTLKENGFHRYTKPILKSFNLKLRDKSMSFRIQSIDVILAPFGIAFMTIRVQLESQENELSNILDFMHHFRVVESKLKEEQGAIIVCPESGSRLTVSELLFERLSPFLRKFILHDDKLNGYFGSLPYFEDERMYASAFLFSKEGSPFTEDQLYRMGTLDGISSDGEKFISANNPDYIRRYLNGTLHDRWAPNTYTVVTEHAFITATNISPEDMSREVSQFMGTHYYNFLLHYFYKMMLLRFAYEYSEINWEKDDEYVKSLIKLITLFSSWYFFQEVSTRSEGKELTKMFRDSFNIDNLFNDVNNTLHELYKSQENEASNRMNMLLFFLTVFTVVSGIYGMNLVVEDWESPFTLNKIFTYTFLEWVSLITAVGGIGLSAYLIVTTFGKIAISKLRKNKMKYPM